MYVTRPLSHYRKFPNSLSIPPPEGPSSGYLIIQDEESVDTCCFGLCKDRYIKELPFPQNKALTVEYSRGVGEHRRTETHKAFFIPVLDHPLSSNRYYVIKASGRHKGEAYTSSREEDMVSCCFCNCVKDVKPRALDHDDTYQQVEISREIDCCGSTSFSAKSIAQDGFPPDFLRRKGWSVYTSNPHLYQLGEAPGLDASLRKRLPQLDFPISRKSSQPVVVGKWYCPFMFVKEEGKLKDQMKDSMFYEMTLEQQWQQIYSCQNLGTGGSNTVNVDVFVQRESVSLSGKEVVEGRNVVDGVMWFSSSGNGAGSYRVGLSMAVVRRMKWEQERVGCVEGIERQVRVKRVEEFGGINGWREFGCYVLVERFCLKKMDGSLLLSFEFGHTNKIQSKWE